jgi:peptidase E
MGGGGFSMEPDNPVLDDFALRLTGADLPRVCFIPTAAGDDNGYIDSFYTAFPESRARARHLSLFKRQRGDLRARLLDNDLIYIGGGSTANLLVLWRLHGFDVLIREAWESGIVLAGISAGACCLFEASLTDSFGPSLAPLEDGLGLLEGSFCAHYDGEAKRRPRYRQVVGEGLVGGYGVEDGAALHFEGTALAGVIRSRTDAHAFRVCKRQGKVRETVL